MPERKKMSANMIRPATAIAGWRTKTSFPSLAAIHSASRVRVFVPASGRLEVAQTAEIAGFRLGAASPGGRLGRPRGRFTVAEAHRIAKDQFAWAETRSKQEEV